MRRKSCILPMPVGSTYSTTESTCFITWQFVQVSNCDQQLDQFLIRDKLRDSQTSSVFLGPTDIAVKHKSKLLILCVTTMYIVKHFKSKCSIVICLLFVSCEWDAEQNNNQICTLFALPIVGMFFFAIFLCVYILNIFNISFIDVVGSFYFSIFFYLTICCQIFLCLI